MSAARGHEDRGANVHDGLAMTMQSIPCIRANTAVMVVFQEGAGRT